MSDTPRLFLTRAARDVENEKFALEQSLAVIGSRNIPSLQAARDYADVQRLVDVAHQGARSGRDWAIALKSDIRI